MFNYKISQYPNVDLYEKNFADFFLLISEVYKHNSLLLVTYVIRLLRIEDLDTLTPFL